MSQITFVMQPGAVLRTLADGLSGPVRFALVRETYTPDPQHSLWSHAEQHEVVGPGYVPGGIAVTPQIALEGTTAEMRLPGPLSWPGASFAAKYVVGLLPDPLETISGALLIGYADLRPSGGEASVVTGTFRVEFNANKIILMSQENGNA